MACIYTSFLLLLSLYSSVLIHAAPYVPSDMILLNCGAAPETTDPDGRIWVTDFMSKFTPTEDHTLTDTASVQSPDVPQVPFMTARMFISNFTYSFPVASGRKFVRLYFYPASYANLNASDAYFSVSSGEFTLMDDFRPAQTAPALNYAFIVKEFSLNVVDGRLNVTFKPHFSPKSYAFVNGIEVVSMPDIYNTENETAAIVGGKPLTAVQDTGMLHLWCGNWCHQYYQSHH